MPATESRALRAPPAVGDSVNATVQLINRIKSLRKGIIEDSSIASTTLVPHAPPEIRDETLQALTNAQSRRDAIQQWQLQDRCMVRDALKNLLEKLGRKELLAVNPKKFCRLLRCKGHNHARLNRHAVLNPITNSIQMFTQDLKEMNNHL